MIWQLLVLPPSLCSISTILSRLELTINVLYGTVHVGKCIFRPFQCFHYMDFLFYLFIYLDTEPDGACTGTCVRRLGLTGSISFDCCTLATVSPLISSEFL